MFIIYFLFFGGLAVWLWLLRKSAFEKGWDRAAGLAETASIAAGIVAVGSLMGRIEDFVDDGLAGMLVGMFFVGLIKAGIGWVQAKLGIGGTGASKDHIRGAKLADEHVVGKQLKGVPSRFKVGQVPIPKELETRGFLLAGSPGTGKSQCLTAAQDALRRDGARAIVADASGIYTSRYFENDLDKIINPFDSRCVPWSPLAELEGPADCPAMAKSLIPDAEGSAAEWNGYAQTLVENLLEFCFENSLANSELFRLACVADLPELRQILAGTPAAPLVSEGNERMFGSVRAIAGSSMKFLQYLSPEAGAGNGFSIRQHIQTEQPGWIFLSYQQQHRDGLKHLIACCMDVSARAVLSLPPSMERRVIFSLDEMPLLGKIQSIIDLATNGRKHGAVIFAGLQTVAQVRESYGDRTAQTLLSCLGSWLVLRVTDAETAEYMSKYLGEEEKTRIVSSGGTSEQSMQFGKNKSENWQQQVVKDRVVLPSELQSMPDLRGIFNLAGPVPSAIVQLEVAPSLKVAEAYVPAPTRKRQRPVFEQNETDTAGGGQRQNEPEPAKSNEADLPY